MDLLWVWGLKFIFSNGEELKNSPQGEFLMDENKNRGKEPKPGRIESLRELPEEILRTLTKQEINAFLYDDEWPDSLDEKLKDYLVDV